LGKKLHNLVKAFKGADSPQAREQLKILRKAERLYLKAAEQSGNVRLLRHLQAIFEDREEMGDETLDNTEANNDNESVQFRLVGFEGDVVFKSGGETPGQAHELALRWANRSKIRYGQKKIISTGFGIYLIEKARNNYRYKIIGEIDYEGKETYNANGNERKNGKRTSRRFELNANGIGHKEVYSLHIKNRRSNRGISLLASQQHAVRGNRGAGRRDFLEGARNSKRLLKDSNDSVLTQRQMI